MTLRNYDDLLNIGFSTKELVTTNVGISNVDALIRHCNFDF